MAIVYLGLVIGMHGFPPTILTSGTRDLLLSNTVRVHRKLRQAGVEAVLQVFEGQSHAQYYRDVNAPETKEAFEEIQDSLTSIWGSRPGERAPTVSTVRTEVK